MNDTNGVEIKIGDTVKSTQPSGGILHPAPAQIGEVVQHKLSYQEEPVLAIKFKRPNYGFYSFILLHGKTNEIINQ